MLKFLSKVRIEFNALDPRIASCMEFLAQCNAPKAKESNPACQIQVKRRTDDHPPEIKVTFVTGAEEVFDATSTSAHTIRSMILEKGQMLENEQMFRDAGLNWPVLIPDEELQQPMAGIKLCKRRKVKMTDVVLERPDPIIYLTILTYCSLLICKVVRYKRSSGLQAGADNQRLTETI
ncbi:39S ribosomal protein [Citrus sinensis]|nr:39S ribosomal protein [Citrus sinensis]